MIMHQHHILSFTWSFIHQIMLSHNILKAQTIYSTLRQKGSSSQSCSMVNTLVINSELHYPSWQTLTHKYNMPIFFPVWNWTLFWRREEFRNLAFGNYVWKQECQVGGHRLIQNLVNVFCCWNPTLLSQYLGSFEITSQRWGVRLRGGRVFEGSSIFIFFCPLFQQQNAVTVTLTSQLEVGQH